MEEKCIDFRCNKNKNNRKTYKKRGFRGVEMGKTYRNPRFLSSFSWKLTKSMRILVDFWSKIRFLGQKVEFFGGSVWKSMEKPGISSKYSVFVWKTVKKCSFSEKMAIFFQKTPFRGPNIGQGLCGPPHPLSHSRSLLTFRKHSAISQSLRFRNRGGRVLFVSRWFVPLERGALPAFEFPAKCGNVWKVAWISFRFNQETHLSVYPLLLLKLSKVGCSGETSFSGAS